MKIQIVVIGRRWFDKHYGNTYHRVSVLDTTKASGTHLKSNTDTGKQYRQTAHELAKSISMPRGLFGLFIH